MTELGHGRDVVEVAVGAHHCRVVDERIACNEDIERARRPDIARRPSRAQTELSTK